MKERKTERQIKLAKTLVILLILVDSSLNFGGSTPDLY